jgi:hypothetical protein
VDHVASLCHLPRRPFHPVAPLYLTLAMTMSFTWGWGWDEDRVLKPGCTGTRIGWSCVGHAASNRLTMCIECDFETWPHMHLTLQWHLGTRVATTCTCSHILHAPSCGHLQQHSQFLAGAHIPMYHCTHSHRAHLLLHHLPVFDRHPQHSSRMMAFMMVMFVAFTGLASAQIPNKTVTYQLNQSTIIMVRKTPQHASMDACALRRATPHHATHAHTCITLVFK